MATSTLLTAGYELELCLAGGSEPVAGYPVTCTGCGARLAAAHLPEADLIVHARLHSAEAGATTPVLRPDGTTVHLRLPSPPRVGCAFCGGYKGPLVPIGDTEDFDPVVAHPGCVPALW